MIKPILQVNKRRSLSEKKPMTIAIFSKLLKKCARHMNRFKKSVNFRKLKN
jgi:hypothetical protein